MISGGLNTGGHSVEQPSDLKQQNQIDQFNKSLYNQISPQHVVQQPKQRSIKQQYTQQNKTVLNKPNQSPYDAIQRFVNTKA